MARLGPGSLTVTNVDATRTAAASDQQLNELLPILAGVAWLIGAAAIGYLAFLQLQYSSLGFADANDARSLAMWNGLSAVITAYFGAMAIIAPSRARMGGGAVWAVLNVAYGAFQISEGLTHEAFLIGIVSFGIAGILAFVAWRQRR